MRILKVKGIYNESKTLAKNNGIAEQKNYVIIALRLGFLFYHCTKVLNIEKDKAIAWIFSTLTQSL